MECERCKGIFYKTCFCYDGSFPTICRDCLTQEEYLEFVQPPLTKWMSGLTPKEKSLVLREIFIENSKEHNEKSDKENFRQVR
jgi:hypothetical protein